MMHDDLFARSFSKHDQRRLGYGAFVGCLFIALSYCTVFTPHLVPLPICTSSYLLFSMFNIPNTRTHKQKTERDPWKIRNNCSLSKHCGNFSSFDHLCYRKVLLTCSPHLHIKHVEFWGDIAMFWDAISLSFSFLFVSQWTWSCRWLLVSKV